MKLSVWTQTYNVNTFLVNPQKRLGLYGLLNLLQDTAWIHATHLGHGYESMLQHQTAWVLTRQKVFMKSWPKWGDDIELKTWIRSVSGLLAVRDFEIFMEGELIGASSTQWLILDLRTRRPAERTVQLGADEVFTHPGEFIEAARIPLNPLLNPLAEFQVRNSDLDLNGHVNNTRYAQWILDSVPREAHQEYRLEEYDVNFLAETKSADVVSVLGGKLEEGKFQFQGLRRGDNKTVFAATMRVLAGQLPPSNISI